MTKIARLTLYIASRVLSIEKGRTRALPIGPEDNSKGGTITAVAHQVNLAAQVVHTLGEDQ